MAELAEPIKLDDRRIALKHDLELQIATGANVYETAWKNKKTRISILWADLQNPVVTSETQEQYMSMTKDQQQRIKDVGGFVGGYIESGRKTVENIKFRSMVTLDLDDAPVNYKELFSKLDYAYAYYSTHKHTPDKPRLRLIIPLNRNVTPDEHSPISRKIASDIGMEYIDPASFRVNQMMFWGSCSSDAEYVFDYNDAEILDADEVLATYTDWTDASSWAYSARENEKRLRKGNGVKLQDPTEKSGEVGLFCRAYSIQDVISELLPDVYAPTDKNDRYTYMQGSTVGGLVIYNDGKFAYSYHATDPIGGLDVNAFDFARLHLFGDLDKDAKEGTPICRMPSYTAMKELVRKDKKCINMYDAERRAEATETSKSVKDDSDDNAWQTKLSRNRNMEIESTVDNLYLIFKNDKNLQGLRYNELSQAIEITKSVCWRAGTGQWTDEDTSKVYVYLALKKNYGVSFKKSDVMDVLIKVASENSYHPIRDWFENLPKWDGVPRAKTLFVDYLGAKDDIYTQEATKKLLQAAVLRVFEPGCKYDEMLILTGPGGCGKSTLVNKLGGSWYTDSLSFMDMKSKDAPEKLRGKWIVEIPELSGIRNSEMTTVKNFLSHKEDRYRQSYGVFPKDYKRCCVFIGTSNEARYLKDTTGNRRFLPIPVTGISEKKAWDMTDEDVKQIFAEIYEEYKSIGFTEEDLILSKEANDIAEKMQMDALETDDRLGIVQEYLDRKIPENWYDMNIVCRINYYKEPATTNKIEKLVSRNVVSIGEVKRECFGREQGDRNRGESDEIKRILLQLGWRQLDKQMRVPGYGPQTCFERLH